MDPIGFYQDVLCQNITQHKARDTSASPQRHKVEVTTKVTHRHIGRILMLVENQLVEFLKGKWTMAELKAAFKDEKIKSQIQKHFRNNSIQLKHKDSGKQIFRRESLLIGQHGEKAKFSEDHPHDEEHDPESAYIVSTGSNLCRKCTTRHLKSCSEKLSRSSNANRPADPLIN